VGRTLWSAAFKVLMFANVGASFLARAESFVVQMANVQVKGGVQECPPHIGLKFSRRRRPGREVGPPGGATTGWEAVRHRESCRGELGS
jgi:hypothetical protein